MWCRGKEAVPLEEDWQVDEVVNWIFAAAWRFWYLGGQIHHR